MVSGISYAATFIRGRHKSTLDRANKILTSKEKAKQVAATEVDEHKNRVTKMKTLEELKSLIVTLITAAKSESGSVRMNAQTASTWLAIDEYNWKNLGEGTSVVSGLFGRNRNQYTLPLTQNTSIACRVHMRNLFR